MTGDMRWVHKGALVGQGTCLTEFIWGFQN